MTVYDVIFTGGDNLAQGILFGWRIKTGSDHCEASIEVKYSLAQKLSI
jgi:hypothetical protein